MKIVFFDVEEWEKEYLTKELAGHEISFFAEHLDSNSVASAKDADVVSTFTRSQISADVINALPNLKWIAIRATGFDNVDLAAAKAKGITVTNVPTYGENTVAEHAFGLILNLSRKIYKSIQNVRETGFVSDKLRGFDLKGKTLGVVGLGHIGQHVARIANGFEMNVLAFDVNQDKKLAKKLGFTYATMEELLAQSDIITLHVPYNKHTHHLINMQNIGMIKKGAYLINTSRGAVCETDALVKALQDGILAGAGLDVLEGEHEIAEELQLLTKQSQDKADFKMLLESHVLMEMDNVIITPHNAFNSQEALERILQTTIENIKGFEAGKPVNVVS